VPGAASEAALARARAEALNRQAHERITANWEQRLLSEAVVRGGGAFGWNGRFMGRVFFGEAADEFGGTTGPAGVHALSFVRSSGHAHPFQLERTNFASDEGPPGRGQA